MTLKKKIFKVVIETFGRVLPNVFNGELNDVIKINQKAKYDMSERLLYCCSIILPLIILQFYCRSAAVLPVLFYHRIMTSESKIWLLSYPWYWSFFIQLLVFLIRWDSASQRFFFFFSWSLMNFFGAAEMENKKHGNILYHALWLFLFFFIICYNSCRFSCGSRENGVIVRAGWPVFMLTVSLSRRWKSRRAAAVLTAHLVCEVDKVLILNALAPWCMTSH